MAYLLQQRAVASIVNELTDREEKGLSDSSACNTPSKTTPQEPACNDCLGDLKEKVRVTDL